MRSTVLMGGVIALFCIGVMACSGPEESQLDIEAGELTSVGGPLGGSALVRGLADPSVMHSPHLQAYIMSGTAPVTDHLPLYLSEDGAAFSWAVSVYPSRLDPAYDYCHIWAPDLFATSDARKLGVTFSASRHPQGRGCGSIDKVSTFKIEVDLDTGVATAPVEINPNGPGPSTYAEPGCRGGIQANGTNCENTIRIDSDVFRDPRTGRTHLFYTWFGHDAVSWNNISSFAEDRPYQVDRRVLAAEVEDEHIVEAPDVFERNGQYYMIYSRGSFSNSYGLGYLMANSVEGLSTQASPRRKLLEPLFGEVSGCPGYSGKNVISAGGHSSTVQVGSAWYIYYHVNEYRRASNGCHQMVARSTYRQRLHFLPDGRLLPLRGVQVAWNDLGPGYEYSLDLKAAGRTYAPCMNSGDIGSATWVDFSGSCGAQPIQDFAGLQFRVCAARGGDWSAARCSAYGAPSSVTLRLNIGGTNPPAPEPPPPAPEPPPASRSLNFTWNSAGPGYAYSLDVISRDGRRFAPCISANRLRDQLSYRFDSGCAGGTAPGVDEVSEARVCAAKAGNWADATCSPYRRVGQGGLQMDIPLRAISFSWNNLGADFEYSLDLQAQDGRRFEPCIHAGIIGGRTAIEYTDSCADGQALPADQVAAARVCAAQGGNWAAARCTAYTPVSAQTRLVIP